MYVLYPDWHFTRSPSGVVLVSSTGQKNTRNVDYLMVRTLQCRCIYLWPGYVDYGYVPLVVTLPGPFLYSWLITGFVTRITRWMPLVEQELPTLQEHLSSPPVFSGVRVTRSLVCCVIFCRSLFGLSFHLRILIAPFGIFKLLLDYMCMDIYTRVTVHNW